MSPKDQAQLKKRLKELDAREEYLNEWEAQLKQSPIDLKVIEAKVKQKEKELYKAQKALDDVLNDIERFNGNYKRASKELAEHQQKFKSAVSEHDAQIKAKKAELSALKADIEAVEREIAERKDYLTDQERLISEAIEDGNAKIIELDAEIQSIAEEKQTKEGVLINLRQQHTDVSIEVQRIEAEFEDRKLTIAQEEEELQKAINEAKLEVGKWQKKLLKVKEEIDGKLQQLKIKEEELLAKRDALNTERFQLEEDKRRWTSTKSLYQL